MSFVHIYILKSNDLVAKWRFAAAICKNTHGKVCRGQSVFYLHFV